MTTVVSFDLCGLCLTQALTPAWGIVNHAGSRLYATNTGDNSIAVYDLADPLN